MPGDERAPELTARHAGAPGDGERAERFLAEGEIEPLGLMPRSSNRTYLVRIVPGPAGTELRAIYKPRAGERPLWDFPEGTLADREVAAYRVAKTLGWPRVPPTILRDGPGGVGSLQLFREFDPGEHFFSLVEGRESEFRRIAAFDAVVNNADRKGGHTLLGSDGAVFVIDHGVCFHVLPKLRTVIWDFAGAPLDTDLLTDLVRTRDAIAAGPLRDELGALLSAREVDATRLRLDRLLATETFPVPGEGHPYPWPAI